MAQHKHNQVVDFSNSNDDKIKSASTKNNMAQQTAVEWYYEQTVIEGKTNYYELLEQAKQMGKEMIYVEIYTHSSVIDGSISFEEFDLGVSSIGVNETLVKKDFDKLWESVNEIETKDLKAEEWYLFGFKRNWEDDGSGLYNQCWFELVETFLIENKL